MPPPTASQRACRGIQFVSITKTKGLFYLLCYLCTRMRLDNSVWCLTVSFTFVVRFPVGIHLTHWVPEGLPSVIKLVVYRKCGICVHAVYVPSCYGDLAQVKRWQLVWVYYYFVSRRGTSVKIYLLIANTVKVRGKYYTVCLNIYVQLCVYPYNGDTFSLRYELRPKKQLTVSKCRCIRDKCKK